MSAAEYELLRDIADHPDDDAPRLVYADWLEERGSPQAEFIRVQCELATLDPYHPRRTELELRELQLIRQHSKGWARSLRGFARRWWFRRGLIERVKLTASDFLRHRRTLFELNPLRDLNLIQAGGDILVDVGKCEELSRINAIGLPRCLIAPNQLSRLRALLMRENLGQLKSLSLLENRLGDAGVSDIAQLPSLAGLTALDLRTTGMSPKGVEQIAQSPSLHDVRHLQLRSCTNIHTNYEEHDLAGPLPRALSPMLDRLEVRWLALINRSAHCRRGQWASSSSGNLDKRSCIRMNSARTRSPCSSHQSAHTRRAPSSAGSASIAW